MPGTAEDSSSAASRQLAPLPEALGSGEPDQTEVICAAPQDAIEGFHAPRHAACAAIRWTGKDLARPTTASDGVHRRAVILVRSGAFIAYPTPRAITPRSTSLVPRAT